MKQTKKLTTHNLYILENLKHTEKKLIKCHNNNGNHWSGRKLNVGGDSRLRDGD